MAAAAQCGFTQELMLIGFPMPITLRPPVPLSDEEIMVFSRRNKPYRIERNTAGELEIMSPTGIEGSRWEAIVISELHLWARDYGGIVFSSNGGFTLPDGSMRSPDAGWIPQARWDVLSLDDRRGYGHICPDFLIEILSATDSRAMLEAKMEMWIANGARLAWMIDPYGATIRIYQPGKEVIVQERPDFIEAEDVVPGFRLTTYSIWSE